MSAFNRLLFTKTDNAPLLVFRIFFGFLVACECYGAILTGWVRRTLVEPHFTFNFIGFDWLQLFQGSGMYAYFFVMGTLGLAIALGYRYRFAVISFTILWTGVYLMQKTSYNNHYYLLILISGIMCLFPAETDYSLDAKYNPSLRRNWMYSYIKWIIVLQLFIVYTYASVAKIYGDWLDFSIIRILMLNKANYPIIGELLQEPWIHKMIGAFGIVFDLLVVPALLWKPTRKLAFVASLFFHLFNSIVFQIGIFPYLSLAFTVFFFEPELIRRIFFKRREPFQLNEVDLPSFRKPLLALMGIYFVIQLALPIRHHFIKDEVLWTEEGHRMSWRMMLRSRMGKGQFKVVNQGNDSTTIIKPEDYLTKKQRARIMAYPDFIWQFAQYLKREYAQKGEHVSVYLINSKVSINGKPYRAFIDPKVDLANETWRHFTHHEWILPSPIEDDSK